MSIKWIGATWRNDLTLFPFDQRVYVDFRQQEYPEIAGAPTFTLIASTDNQPGSHNLTGGYANYLLDMPSTLTLDIYFKPTFGFATGTDQYLWGWSVDATHYLSFRYDQTLDKYLLAWKDGGTERTMVSAAYASDLALQVWTRATFSLDLTTGTNAGSAFYLAGALVSATWSGATDVKARYFPTFNVRNLTGTAGSYTVNYLRLFQSKTTSAAEVAANFSTLKNEETVWHFNGHAVGHTRCNVTNRMRSMSMEKSTETPAGGLSPNKADMVLMSTVGQFADDQYATFSPTTEVYNGTSAQKYMQKRTPVEVETWDAGLFELEISGRVDDNLWKRHSVIDDVSVVTLTVVDRMDEIRKAISPVAHTYDSYDLSKPSDETTSLIHTIARLVTLKSWSNYLGNSGFENATIGNSWVVAGAGATFSRVAGGLIGGFQGDLVYVAAAASVFQVTTFTGTKKIDVGQNWNFSVYLKAAAGSTGTLRISGYSGSATETEFATTAYTLAGGEGWRKFEVGYTVATSTVDRIRCTVTKAEAGTVSLDVSMLIQRLVAVNWNSLNATDGASGVISADSAAAATYNSMGFDVDDAPVTHGWVLVEQGDKIGEHLGDIADATAAMYLGMDGCGTLKYRTPFKAGYADPSSILTVTALTGVDAIIDVDQANHIIIRGVQIIKDSTSVGKVILWNAKNSGSFNTVNGADIYEQVSTGANWPSTAIYPEYWAKYSEQNK